MSEQKQVKRYRLKKDMQMPNTFCAAGTQSIFLNGYYNFAYQEGGGVFGKGFACTDPENYPDWFEEVKDEPKYRQKIRLTPDGSQGVFSTRGNWKPDFYWYRLSLSLTPQQNHLVPNIEKAIEDIVNGIDNAPDIDRLQREAFEAARELRDQWEGSLKASQYPIHKYSSFQDYKQSKLSGK
jgi:hypothetical protein